MPRPVQEAGRGFSCGPVFEVELDLAQAHPGPVRVHGHPYLHAEAVCERGDGLGALGKKILGSEFSLDIYLHRGAAAYICGEETGLIESLEGKRAWPRIPARGRRCQTLRPPIPAAGNLLRSKAGRNTTGHCIPFAWWMVITRTASRLAY